ncbi:MAG: YlbF family regulator [Candidatus Omnitrophica bacterium]|nr:YlbF family regulator [Candidatus Omnitrophota bacterium]
MSDEEIEEIRRKKIQERLSELNDPKRKAREFAKAIVESPTYKNFIDANKEVQENQELQNLLREFQEKQLELQWKGFDQKILQELRDLQEKLNTNSTFQKFINSQNELVALLRKTNSIISQRIGQEFAQRRGGGCCG